MTFSLLFQAPLKIRTKCPVTKATNILSLYFSYSGISLDLARVSVAPQTSKTTNNLVPDDTNTDIARQPSVETLNTEPAAVVSTKNGIS